MITTRRGFVGSAAALTLAPVPGLAAPALAAQPGFVLDPFVATIVAGSFASELIIESGMGCSHAMLGSAESGRADGSSDGAPNPDGSCRPRFRPRS